MASNSTKPHPWFEICHSRPSAKYQVFIFPGAGVPGFYYNNWDKDFPEYEFSLVIYPGRAKRLGEKCLTTIEEYLTQLDQELLPYVTKPCIFIGHSIGTMISFAFARHIIETTNKGDLIKLILAMGRGAPHAADIVLEGDQSYVEQTDEELVQDLKRSADPNTVEIYDYQPFVDMVLPMYRADAKIGNVSVSSTPINTPIIVYEGEKDEGLNVESLNRWLELTTNKDLFRVRLFPGHHNFQSECQNQVLQCMKEDFNNVLNNSKV
ncbi:unnamed protein product [Adineta steineri]|uniref:oleoyl-[acyl-carrier-protein] hydrolase n=1 Tax=Adineta steineri TaxID=433720 RepID=A0A814FTX3_9BILA|nr:unnamed protein product [Adineta steineri]CAF0987462.1 unnamed protein product [Adineta steineri]CAF4000457.1 unnamed protein product [Adineta steineri]CAF4159691.1 unnamed protein product [Adineta steineri]